MNEILSNHTVHTISNICVCSMCTPHTHIHVERESAFLSSKNISNWVQIRNKRYIYIYQPITQHVLCFVILQESICVSYVYIYKCVVIVSEPGFWVYRKLVVVRSYFMPLHGYYRWSPLHCRSIVKRKIPGKWNLNFSSK